MKSLIWWSVTWRPGKRRLLAGETAIPHDRPAAITRQRAPPGDTPTLTLIDALLSPRSSRYNSMDRVRHGGDQRVEKACRDPLIGLFVQLNEGELARAVDGNKQVELAL